MVGNFDFTCSWLYPTLWYFLKNLLSTVGNRLLCLGILVWTFDKVQMITMLYNSIVVRINVSFFCIMPLEVVYEVQLRVN